MTTTIDSLPKPAKALPEPAKVLFVDAYNQDFGTRCSESHAEKAAWRVVMARYRKDGDEWIAL